MHKTQLLIALFCMLLCQGCNDEKHFITNETYRTQVEKDFEKKQALLPEGSLFEVFNTPLTTEEKEALTFLYAYMPIGDVTDYDGDFYLRNIRSSFATREEMPWGKVIPEDIFRHFVLPVRVNNENLDESRMIFYDELKERVKNLSLYDAVLEVNHWCHEKVIYTPSDARTRSPIASVRPPYGRCGVESSVTTTALRAVGIPARQVYTPRWAHTDDNHAWVEAWVDGKWYFLGACEPEPVLNLGWFNGPAYRGMLMHTKAFGRYNGPEEVMEETDAYTEINVIDNYAPTAKAYVTVVDENNNPVAGANVEFKIYNYAEFFTVANKKTDTSGKTFLSAGKGDMLVWATKDGKFGYSKVSFGQENDVTIKLDKKPGDSGTIALDIVPPVEGTIEVEVTEEQKEENARRLLEEDVIRNKYVDTFYTEEKAEALAKELGINPLKTADYLIGSRGNWREIEKFLRETPADLRDKAMELLSVVSTKDLRDTPASVLTDHLLHANNTNNELFVRYILNPRIAYELLSPYRGFFQQQVDEALKQAAKQDPKALVEWTSKHITVNDGLNPQAIPVMPAGVWKAKVADAASRDIFFIALARSMDIAARLEPVTGKVQYYNNGWVDVDFGSGSESVSKQGKVVASYTPIKTLQDPKYFNHFTIAKMLPDAKLQTLNFRSGANVDMGLGNTWSGLLKKPLAIDEGNYLMVTGTRMANGSVLVNLDFFTVNAGETTNLQLVMRENTDNIQVIGSIDAESKFIRTDNGEETSILTTTGRGYFVLAILGARQEPTNHAMRDIAHFKQDFEEWGRSMILLFKDEQGWKNFDTNEFGILPNTITYGLDINNTNTEMLVKAMNLPNGNNLPIFVIADTFGRVVFVSQGYTIGLGEQMMKVIHKL
ncbi:MAG: transglutaminase domain-containing protein [Tannerellaceae bacterium]|nr:transglutaminase domain-containing protein [Tannerellaceae bacterium]